VRAVSLSLSMTAVKFFLTQSPSLPYPSFLLLCATKIHLKPRRLRPRRFKHHPRHHQLPKVPARPRRSQIQEQSPAVSWVVSQVRRCWPRLSFGSSAVGVSVQRGAQPHSQARKKRSVCQSLTSPCQWGSTMCVQHPAVLALHSPSFSSSHGHFAAAYRKMPSLGPIRPDHVPQTVRVALRLCNRDTNHPGF
jgi:hypothetical protein